VTVQTNEVRVHLHVD